MVRTSLAAALIEPLAPLPSLALPKTVGRLALNVPGLPASSVSVTVSISPVVPFVTVTSIVPSPARSASTTSRTTGSPTTVAVNCAVPVVPPLRLPFSATLCGEPLGVSGSL